MKITNRDPIADNGSENRVRDHLAFIGEMSATVSHELNGPLSTILMSIELIRQWMNREDLTEPQKDTLGTYIGRAETAATRMMSINENVLSYSHSSNTEFGDFVLQDMLHRCSDLMQPRLDSTNIELEIVAPTTPLMLRGSDVALEQVVCNLANNSIDSVIERRSRDLNSSFAGKIRIGVELENNGQVRITVSDNGTGISAETRDRVFQPFFTTKPAGSGTGLGLPFSRKIVQHHGGTLEVTDLKSGGAAFHCTLPLSHR